MRRSRSLGIAAAVIITIASALLLAASTNWQSPWLRALRLPAGIWLALVPVLIGATDGGSLGHALVHGYQPAMITLGALCVAAALVSALFVSDDRRAAAH